MNGDHIVKEELKQALQSINERLNRLQHQVQSIDTGEAYIQGLKLRQSDLEQDLNVQALPYFVKNQNNNQKMPYFSSTKPEEEKYRNVRHSAVPYKRNSSNQKKQHSQKKTVEVHGSSVKFSPMKIKISNKENLDISVPQNKLKLKNNTSLYQKFQPKEFDQSHSFIMINAPSQHVRSQSIDPTRVRPKIEGRNSEVYHSMVPSPQVKSSFLYQQQSKSIITYGTVPYSVKNYRQINTPLQFNMINLSRQIPLFQKY